MLQTVFACLRYDLSADQCWQVQHLELDPHRRRVACVYPYWSACDGHSHHLLCVDSCCAYTVGAVSETALIDLAYPLDCITPTPEHPYRMVQAYYQALQISVALGTCI